ncbi:MAG: hypothetical protein A4E19_01230 [Nitrospira sp. SG-bin1]|nr:MAG: hypothetical protein A4E19_01230 [Nitrospira sp. SG-bin1]
MVHERVVLIGEDHPSVAGHFPNQPIVPGVVLLGEVFEMLRLGLAAPIRVTQLSAVKFSSPLRPGEALTIRVEEDAIAHAVFSCHVQGRPVASGSIEFTRAERT